MMVLFRPDSRHEWRLLGVVATEREALDLMERKGSGDFWTTTPAGIERARRLEREMRMSPAAQRMTAMTATAT